MNSGIFLSLGSNMGDREGMLRQAIKLMPGEGITVVRESSIYETEPWGNLEQENFLNQVIEAQTSFTPGELLQKLLHIESVIGRQRTIRWGPRSIDIDILLFGNVSIATDALTLPHPAMHQRRFTLVPLVELAPSGVHPLLQKSFSKLLEECSDPQAVWKWTGK